MPRLLLIAYYFPPHRLVGSFRAAGFHRYLPEYGWETTVVTATASDGLPADPNVIRLPEPPRAPAFWIKDPSAAWADHHRGAIAEIIESQKPDAILLTGGPFLYFKLGPWIAKRFGLPYILDYRDPFRNPRHPSRPLRDTLAYLMERHWNARSTAILIPTERMRDLVSAPPRVPVHVVENGFDDGVMEQLSPEKSASTGEGFVGRSFVYAGKYYEKASPMPLLRILKSASESGAPSRLVHVGTPVPAIEAEARREGLPLETMGQRTYAESVMAIREGDVGIILSEGHRFEATTKVYDYIALDKPILGVGVSAGSGIHEILERYGRYRLCENDEADIARALADATWIERRAVDTENSRRFGRRFQTKRLAGILEQVLP